MIQTKIEILLVEDTRSDAEMTIRALKKNNVNCNIVHVKDGRAALDYLYGLEEFAGRDIGSMPKVILMDLKMPRMNGIETLQQLKANELTKKIPVVILTSSKENPDIQTCYDLGANSYIVKPVEFQDFVKVVSDLGLYWMLHNQSPT